MEVPEQCEDVNYSYYFMPSCMWIPSIERTWMPGTVTNHVRSLIKSVTNPANIFFERKHYIYTFILSNSMRTMPSVRTFRLFVLYTLGHFAFLCSTLWDVSAYLCSNFGMFRPICALHFGTFRPICVPHFGTFRPICALHFRTFRSIGRNVP